jgi:hypothetical protein
VGIEVEGGYKRDGRRVGKPVFQASIGFIGVEIVARGRFRGRFCLRRFEEFFAADLKCLLETCFSRILSPILKRMLDFFRPLLFS